MEPQKTFYTRKELQDRAEKHGKIDRGIYERALKEGCSVSTLLEQNDPSEQTDTLDAFGRMMALTGIRTTSNLKTGVFADKVERFYASDQPVSIVLFPEFINREMRVARLEQDYTSEIVAVTTPVDSDVYRSIYVDMTDKTKFQMKRAGQGTELHRAKLKTQENSVSLYKYGIILEASYEALRRMRIDQMRVHLNLIGKQTALDKLGTAIDVIVNGDGNSNAATNTTTVSLDSTCPSGAITYKAWISWLMSFYPYTCTTVMGTVASLVKLLSMQFPGGDPLLLLAQYANNPNGLQVELAQGVFVNIRLVIATAAPAGYLVGVDKAYALEQLLEIGGTLTETDKIISSQFTEIALSEVVGYDKLYPAASRTLQIS